MFWGYFHKYTCFYNNEIESALLEASKRIRDKVWTSKNGSVVPLEGLLYLLGTSFCMKLGAEKLIEYFAPNHRSYWSGNHCLELKCQHQKKYLTEKTGIQQRKQREVKSGVTAGMHLYDVYVFCVAQHFVLTGCKRFYVISESMKLERIRLDILKKDINKVSVIHSVP